MLYKKCQKLEMVLTQWRSYRNDESSKSWNNPADTSLSLNCASALKTNTQHSE